MLKLADIWRQMARYGVFRGLWYGIVQPDRKTLKKRLTAQNYDDLDFEGEKLRDNMLDAAWAAGELELMIYKDR
jgi:hypothetical protein